MAALSCCTVAGSMVLSTACGLPEISERKVGDRASTLPILPNRDHVDPLSGSQRKGAAVRAPLRRYPLDDLLPLGWQLRLMAPPVLNMTRGTGMAERHF